LCRGRKKGRKTRPGKKIFGKRGMREKESQEVVSIEKKSVDN